MTSRSVTSRLFAISATWSGLRSPLSNAAILLFAERSLKKSFFWLALVPIFLRRLIRIPISVLTVAAVAFSAQAIMLSFGVRVNMFNFAAIPITIGVGSDYLVNLFGAMDAFGTDARHAAARMGGAILLCSLTTVVGYLSLVFAQSGALRTFGWAAVLGATQINHQFLPGA